MADIVLRKPLFIWPSPKLLEKFLVIFSFLSLMLWSSTREIGRRKLSVRKTHCTSSLKLCSNLATLQALENPVCMRLIELSVFHLKFPWDVWAEQVVVIVSCQGLLRVNDKCEAGLCHAPLAPSSTKMVRGRRPSEWRQNRQKRDCGLKKGSGGRIKKSLGLGGRPCFLGLEEATKEERFLGCSPGPALL